MKKLIMLALVSILSLSSTNVLADCRSECVDSGVGIAIATGCTFCGALHAMECIRFECN